MEKLFCECSRALDWRGECRFCRELRIWRLLRGVREPRALGIPSRFISPCANVRRAIRRIRALLKGEV